MPYINEPHFQYQEYPRKKQKIQSYYMIGTLEAKLLKTLNEHDLLQRGDICELTGEAWTTVYDNLYLLSKNKYVISFRKRLGNRGQPPAFYQITDKGKQWILENQKEKEKSL